MALINVCDRCGRATPLKPAFGGTAELCSVCSNAFDAWWSAGKREGAKARSTVKVRAYIRGQPYRLACQLIAKHGYAGPEELALLSGQSRRDAYYTLRYLTRRGLLEGGQCPGLGTRFYLAVPQGVPCAAE